MTDAPILTLKQTQVIRAAHDCDTAAQISRATGIKLRTVRYHTNEAFRALGVNSLHRAVMKAHESGEVTFESSDRASLGR